MKGNNVKTLEAIRDYNRDASNVNTFLKWLPIVKIRTEKNTLELISLVYETFPTFNFGFYLSYPLCKLLFEV